MSDMLSQEEVDALLGGGDDDTSDDTLANDDFLGTSDRVLTSDEIDAIGEVGNISMGTAATTLFTLLGKKVTITTPRVVETDIKTVANELVEPCVVIKIIYEQGIEGMNMLVLHENDVKIITDLMMGGEGTEVSQELNDLHLSAISEAMNQMIGSSSTSLSEMLKTKIDISPPEAIYESISNIDTSDFGLTEEEKVVKIAFRMTVGDLIDSEIMQILPYNVAKQMVVTVTNDEKEASNENDIEIQTINNESKVNAMENLDNIMSEPVQNIGQNAQQQIVTDSPVYQQQQQRQTRVAPQMVNASPLQFNSFDTQVDDRYYSNEIDLIKDVPLEISVELGRTSKKINEILEFGTGTVIELNKLVGEPLDVLANGKKIATGEVVVVDENYGIRISDIIIPKSLLNG